MSLVLKMLRAFPKGRTSEEILVLVGASFSHDKRIATLAEIDQLLADGHIRKDGEGRWEAKKSAAIPIMAKPNGSSFSEHQGNSQFLDASASEFHVSQLAVLPEEAEDVDTSSPIEPKNFFSIGERPFAQIRAAQQRR